MCVKYAFPSEEMFLCSENTLNRWKNVEKQRHIIHSFATGSTPVCDNIFESVDNTTTYVVLGKHFFKKRPLQNY